MLLHAHRSFRLFLLLSAFVHVTFGRRLASSGCGHSLDTRLSPGAPSQAFRIHSAAGGGNRQYLLHLPKNYKRGQSSPLVLAFHGLDQTAAAFEKETRFSELDHNSLNAIIAYPQGLDYQWNGDPRSPPTSKVNDLIFISDLLNHLEKTYCISKDRVYAAGFSNGGGLTHLLACDTALSKRIAAFAASSAAIYQDASLKEPLFGQCLSRGPPVPFLEFHGTDDPVIDYDGHTPDGATSPVPNTMAAWAQRNGCPAESQNKTVVLHDGIVQKYSWTCGKFVDVVTHYRIIGMGHGWASTWPVDNEAQRRGPTPVDGTSIVMEFFDEWRLPADFVIDAGRDEL